MHSRLASLVVIAALLAPVAASASVMPYDSSSGIPIPFGGASKSSSSSSRSSVASYSSSSSSLPARTERVAMRQLLGYEKSFVGKQINRTLRDVVAETNRERRKYGLENLREDSDLSAFAQAYAKDMSERGYFGHDMPEGISFEERIKASAYFATLSACSGCRVKLSAGENVASGQTTPEAVVKDWIASPEHHANMIDPDFSKIGIGRMGKVWVQVFIGLSEASGSSSSAR